MAKVEIEIESEESCDCCDKCGMGKDKPEESRDSMLAELKTLLNDNRANGMAERMARIDELMATLSED
jgi:hypothetical protein